MAKSQRNPVIITQSRLYHGHAGVGEPSADPGTGYGLLRTCLRPRVPSVLDERWGRIAGSEGPEATLRAVVGSWATIDTPAR